MEPASALTASQNYRGGSGGGRQGSCGDYGRNSRGLGRDGRQGSRPSYDGQQHDTNNSLHSFGSGGQSSSRGEQGTYERDRPTCQICQKIGHTAVRCWFRYEESRNSDNRANYASQVGPSSEWLLDTGANMHVLGSQYESFVDYHLEKVQKVGAHFQLHQKRQTFPTIDRGLRKVTCLFNVIFPHIALEFLQLEKAHSRTLAKTEENQGEESFMNNLNPGGPGPLTDGERTYSNKWYQSRSEEDSSNDDDIPYLIKRFQKIVWKSWTLRRECPLLKAENKEYEKPRGDKEKRRDLVLYKNDRKVAADYEVKKALAAWRESSSDLEDLDEPNDVSMVVVHEEETIFNEMFAFMAHSENEDDEDKVTLLDMKHDLNTYSLKKLRTLANVMIDSMVELTSERYIMNAELKSLNENRDKMGEKMLKIEDQMAVLEYEKIELKKQLHLINEKAEKQKVGERSSSQKFPLTQGTSRKDDLRKFDPRSDEGVFVGYSSSSKAYKVFNKKTQCIEKSIHVVFDEDGNLKGAASKDEDELIEMFNSQKIDRSEADINDQSGIENADQSSSKKADEVEKYEEEPGTMVNSSQNISNAPENEEFLEEEHTDKLNQLTLRPGWKHSSSHQLYNLISHLFKEVRCGTRPIDRTIVGTRWDLKNKLDENGVITRNKSRLVVQGYNHEEGIDYDETFAPVARMEAIRILIAFAAFIGFKIYQMDFKSAFLTGDLKEEVFVKQPLGFEDAELPNHVFKLNKQSSDGISISQEKYIMELLKKFNMFDSKPIDSPMGTNSKLVAV
ncbi:uncharacterized protein [Solanum lycopersicum]|uniref:uncharacterized protein n=1 Tax=Solanum lycopersicum TaxID=4081 RepID=UPI003749F6DA